jgi:hypothetical protein
MYVSDLLTNLRNIHVHLRDQKQCSVQWCKAELNWLGDAIKISISYTCHKTGYEDSFSAEAEFDNELSQAIDNAWGWAESIPNLRWRAVYSNIRRLRGAAEVADSASAFDEANRAAWDQLSKMLRQEAETISRRGLPKPDRRLD